MSKKFEKCNLTVFRKYSYTIYECTLIIEIKSCTNRELFFSEETPFYQTLKSDIRCIFIIILIDTFFKPVDQLAWILPLVHHFSQTQAIEIRRCALVMVDLKLN